MNDNEWAARLRAPFPAEVIGHKPQGGVQLAFVGHAAVTDRLLEVDPAWTWEPFAVDATGLPALDRAGNLWIRLTICGVTRIGVGDGKSMKEAVGDCLVRDTPITTARGVVAIQDVRIGDQVPTRQGWRPVTDKWLSHRDAPVMTVTFTDGRTITGTPHHSVPTDNGVKRIESLRKGDGLYSWADNANYLAPKKSSGTAGGSADHPSIPTAAAGFTSWLRRSLASIFTAPSTSSTSSPSRPGGTSTTLITTRSTTTRRTLRPLSRPRTYPTTVSDTDHSSESVPAAATSSRATRLGRSGAAQGAKRRGVGTPDWLSRSPERAGSVRLALATNAGTITAQSSPGNDSALLRVSSVGCAGTAEVWNLSVGEVHEYVANGVFVHNSIRNAAMRYGVALDLWTRDELESQVATPTTVKVTAQRKARTTAGDLPPLDAAAPPPMMIDTDIIGPAPAPVTPAQLGKIGALFTRCEWADRDDRLRATSKIIGRTLTTSKELSKTEGSQLIEVLQSCADAPDPSQALTQTVAT